MSLQIEHPDPRALAPALVAQLSGPTGSKVLR
jgi:hypothetical protein